MEFAANIEVLQADLTPPPGYERTVEAPAQPAKGLVFRLEQPKTTGRDSTEREQLRKAPMTSVAQRPANAYPLRTSGTINRRLVTAEYQKRGALTEAVSDTSMHPVTAIGRITAQFGNKTRHCTGTVVAESVVLTAAHCLYSRKSAYGVEAHFADWITFEPGYSGGKSSGTWAGDRVYIHKGWSSPASGSNASPYDYAFPRLDAPIAHVTGTASISTDTDPEGPFTALGYPRYPTANFQFDGEFLYASTGKRIRDNSHNLLQAENGLTEGSSGGPWLMQTNEGLAVVGINSTKPLRGNGSTWSPVFSDSFQRLLGRVLADMTGT
jgi:protease YdgD